MELTQEQLDEVNAVLHEIRVSDRDMEACPKYMKYSHDMGRLVNDIGDHLVAIADLIDQNPVACAIFKLAFSVSLRTTGSLDYCAVLGDGVEVRVGLLDLVKRVNNHEGVMTYDVTD